MTDNQQLLQPNPLAKYSVNDLVHSINDRSHLYRVFENVEYRQIEILANLALEELRIRALSGQLDPRRGWPPLGEE